MTKIDEKDDLASISTGCYACKDTHLIRKPNLP